MTKIVLTIVWCTGVTTGFLTALRLARQGQLEEAWLVALALSILMATYTVRLRMAREGAWP